MEIEIIENDMLPHADTWFSENTEISENPQEIPKIPVKFCEYEEYNIPNCSVYLESIKYTGACFVCTLCHNIFNSQGWVIKFLILRVRVPAHIL